MASQAPIEYANQQGVTRATPYVAPARPAVANLSTYARDERGIPFTLDAHGQRRYLNAEAYDPKGNAYGDLYGSGMDSWLGHLANPETPWTQGSDQSFVMNGRQWNEQTGTWDRDVNWNNVTALATLATIGGGVAAGASGGVAGAGAGGVGLGETGATVGTASMGAAPAAAGTGTLGGLMGGTGGVYGSGISAGASTAGQVYSSKKQADAAESAAGMQTAAANHAADLQKQAADEALAYTKEQARQTQANFNTTQQANYSQWASGQRRLGTLGEMFGYGARDIPGYVPATDATAPPTTPGSVPTSAPGTAPGTAPAPGGGAPPAGAVPNGDYQGWFNSLVGGKPVTQQTLLDLEPTLNAAGVKLTPPNAVGDRTKIGLPDGSWVRVGFGEGKWVWNPQGGTTTAPRSVAPALAPNALSATGGLSTFGAALQPVATPLTGTLTLPPPGTFAQYLQGGR